MQKNLFRLKFLRSRRILALLFILAVTIAVLAHREVAVDGWYERPARVPQPNSSNIVEGAKRRHVDSAFYDDIFLSVAQGMRDYADPERSLLIYPGAPGTRGRQTEGLEGFARTGVLIAAWLYGGRSKLVMLPDGSELNLHEFLIQGIKNGINRNSTGYWGDIQNYDQRIVEAADVALIVWMLSERSMLTLTEEEQKRLLGWLSQVADKKIYGGNWHLFPLVVFGVIDYLQGGKTDLYNEVMAKHWTDIDDAYVADGWYSDGKGGRIDLYNAWQIHYLIFWLDKIRVNVAGLDHAKNRERLEEFVRGYVHFFSTEGFPIFGRSLCYRMAVAAPLFAHYLSGGTAVSAPDIRRASDSVSAYFVARGAFKDGVITQGYCSEDTRWLENYSGRGSCMWGLRALVLMYLSPPSDSIWSAEGGRIPVERTDFDIVLARGQLAVRGEVAGGTTVVRLHDGGSPTVGILDSLPLYVLTIAEYFVSRPMRAPRFDLKYGLREYRSDAPFCGCVVSKEVE